MTPLASTIRKRKPSRRRVRRKDAGLPRKGGVNTMEQPPQSRKQKEERRPRDTAFWAKRVERLEVSDAPAGAINLNVQGRHEVGALQGFGPLRQKTYRVLLTGAGVTPAEVVWVWKERFPEFHPPQNRFYPSLAGQQARGGAAHQRLDAGHAGVHGRQTACIRPEPTLSIAKPNVPLPSRHARGPRSAVPEC
jgi:hypothetical protein